MGQEAQRTIAVIDGDQASRALVVRTLESLGHRVVESSSSQGLLKSLAGLDALIVDPVVATDNAPARFDLGLDLLTKLRRQSPAMPIAVISADTRADVIVRTMRLGVADYVTKPADRARLLVTATRLMEQAQSDTTGSLTALPALSEIETRLIERALAWNRGQVARTARMLGIGRATLYRKLGEMGHPLPRGGKRRGA